ncbi:hypothetical protein Hdeb2414_s0022g00617301 [Helianthus debilis subsp. tardiflorus]
MSWGEHSIIICHVISPLILLSYPKKHRGGFPQTIKKQNISLVKHSMRQAFPERSSPARQILVAAVFAERQRGLPHPPRTH